MVHGRRSFGQYGAVWNGQIDRPEPGSASSRNGEMDAMADHLFLPEKEELDKLLRHECMIDQQLNRAIAE
jgi:hypothetical protein